MRIEVLQEGVGLPLDLGPSATDEAPLAPILVDQIRQGRLWHLLLWSDDSSKTLGFWHKGRSIAFRRDEMDGFAIEFMRPAKGPGWVSLDARVRRAGQQPVLQAQHFSADALAWLLQNYSRISRVCGCEIVVLDRGSDY